MWKRWKKQHNQERGVEATERALQTELQKLKTQLQDQIDRRAKLDATIADKQVTIAATEAKLEHVRRELAANSKSSRPVAAAAAKIDDAEKVAAELKVGQPLDETLLKRLISCLLDAKTVMSSPASEHKRKAEETPAVGAAPTPGSGPA